MNLKINNMLEHLAIVNQVIDNKSTMPILNCVRLNGDGENVTLTGSNLEIEITTIAPAEIIEPGRACINSEKLTKFSKIYDDVAIKLDKDTAILKAKGKSVINTLPFENYPEMIVSNDDDSISLTLDASKLSYCINQIIHAVGVHDVRFFLNGIKIEYTHSGLTLIASDGHRLSIAKMEYESNNNTIECIIHGKCAQVLSKLFNTGTIDLVLSKNNMSCSNQVTTIKAKNIDAKYPNFQKVLDVERNNSFEIDSKVFSQAINSVLVTTNDKVKGVVFRFSKGNVNISSYNVDKEISEIDLAIDYNDKEISIGLCATYVLDALKNSPKSKISIDDLCSSMLIQPNDENITHIVMAMRI